MAYVEVDVDLGDIETYELCDELINRFKNTNRKQITDKQKEELKVAVTELVAKLGLLFGGNVSISSLDDKMKIELINNIWNKYTYYQLEEKLK
jgi:hypothetical protein